MDDHALWQEMLSAYADGELSPMETAELEDHLKGCERCRSALALLRGMSAALGSESREPPEALARGARFLYEKDSGRKGLDLRRWRFTAIAAVLCLAIFGVVKLAPWGGNAVPESQAAPMMMAAAGGSLADAEELAATEVPAQRNSAAAATALNSAMSAPSNAPEPETAEAYEDTVTGGTSEPAAEAGTDYGGVPKSAMYSVTSQPGHAIYVTLENPEQFYSVCFVYGEVPQSIRENRECTPLESPEGQERWLAPLEVCMNEGLLEQFDEIYYGDLLSKQGLVIGILDMEEEKWLP